MRRIGLTITFTDDNGETRTETRYVETAYDGDPPGERRVAHILLSELKVTVGEQADQKHNATALAWLQFPGQPATFDQYFDIRNSQAVWYELASLIMGAEADLVLAQAFKVLESPQEPPLDDNVAVNDLYYVHDRKITLLNQSVHALIKVQELVNRLLHESLGGDLVDTSKQDWEKTQLTRKNVVKGLEGKRASSAISPAHFETITQALAIPKNTTTAQTAQNYRNRLMHHVRPSVDYSMFFSPLESRAGEEIKDAQGKIIGRHHLMLAKSPVQYRFQDLHTAFSEYLDAVVAMLQQLSQINILRR
jgi:hypothetical protein